MPGAEEFYRRSQDDDRLARQINLQTQAQARSLENLGPILAQGAGAVPNALVGGMNAFLKGRALARSEEEQNQKMELDREEANRENAKSQLDNMRAAGQIDDANYARAIAHEGEGEHFNYLDQLNKSHEEGALSDNDYSKALSEENQRWGKGSLGEQAQKAKLRGEIQEPSLKAREVGVAESQAETSRKEAGTHARAVSADIKHMSYVDQSDQAKTARAHAEQEMNDAATKLDPTERQNAINAVLTKYGVQNDPGWKAMAASAVQGVQSHRYAAALSSAVTLNSTPAGQKLNTDSSAAQTGANTVVDLAKKRDLYKSMPDPTVAQIGGWDNAKRLGKLVESPSQAQTRKDFADTLEANGQKELADSVRNASVYDVDQRMNNAMYVIQNQNKTMWNHVRQGHLSNKLTGGDDRINETDQALANAESAMGPVNLPQAGNQGQFDLTGGRQSPDANAAFLNPGGGAPAPGATPPPTPAGNQPPPTAGTPDYRGFNRYYKAPPAQAGNVGQ